MVIPAAPSAGGRVGAPSMSSIDALGSHTTVLFLVARASASVSSHLEFKRLSFSFEKWQKLKHWNTTHAKSDQTFSLMDRKLIV
jgi:hypothetical protein